MKFQTVGKIGNPLLIMLPGSFCPSASLKYLYAPLSDAYRILLPEYNGLDAGTAFTTRSNEAREIADYLQAHDVRHIRMLYGQSMGAEVGIELFHQLRQRHVEVDCCFWDGAPCIRLPRLYRKFMVLKFKSLLGMVRGKDIDHILKSKFLQKFSGGDPESLRPMLEAMAAAAPLLTDESIRNEAECCYTFDFPPFDEADQKKMHFFYGGGEKAYRTCFRGVKRAYPLADYTVVDGYGHLTYSFKRTADYLEKLRALCEG